MSLANPPSTVVEVDLRTRRAPAPVTTAPARRRSLVAVERVLLAVAVGLVVAGGVLRFVTHSSLWLDEALTVTIARRPGSPLFAPPRQDGPPPLYYLVLHFWMELFGGGDTAV